MTENLAILKKEKGQDKANKAAENPSCFLVKNLNHLKNSGLYSWFGPEDISSLVLIKALLYPE